MTDPMQIPPPQEPMQRIVTLARDLAYHAMQGRWSSNFGIYGYPSIQWFNKWRMTEDDTVGRYLATKWAEKHPPVSLLVSFGYMMPGSEEAEYILTEKAFQLLEKPDLPAKIFISYSRKESSAFALLILARLKAAGLDAFLDMQDIAPGDDWHARLENEVKARDYLICLIGPTTLDSPYVQQEIKWALQTKTVRTIPVWHNGFAYSGGNSDSALHDFLSNKNAIIVDRENTREYNDAVILILNYFGIAPT